jgi:hypothetical protein
MGKILGKCLPNLPIHRYLGQEDLPFGCVCDPPGLLVHHFGCQLEKNAGAQIAAGLQHTVVVEVNGLLFFYILLRGQPVDRLPGDFARSFQVP